MDLIDRLRELSARIPRQLEFIQTEEATKNALVMPFIAALGYNVFDPSEVTPELNADIGVKKGEKVDYAVLRDGKPIILIECKHHNAPLTLEHASQLYRYFSVTEARFAILTNGLVYRFYTDLEASNKMDSKPFFEFNLQDVREGPVEELKKFSKATFDLNSILTTASELKYTREIARYLADQMQEPSDDFVKVVASHVYSGRMTQPVKEQFTQFTLQAFKQVINDRITERLKSALVTESALPAAPATAAPAGDAGAGAPAAAPEEPIGRVVTTEEEVEAFYVTRAILREVVSVKRVVMRDVQTYCGILLDDNNRKPICRLYFGGSQKYIMYFNTQTPERVPIEQIDDLYKYAERLKEAVVRYDQESPPKKRVLHKETNGANGA